ncbi:MAG: RhtB family transporter, partial [uncultured Truepera sp.]
AREQHTTIVYAHLVSAYCCTGTRSSLCGGEEPRAGPFGGSRFGTRCWGGCPHPLSSGSTRPLCPPHEFSTGFFCRQIRWRCLSHLAGSLHAAKAPREARTGGTGPAPARQRFCAGRCGQPPESQNGAFRPCILAAVSGPCAWLRGGASPCAGLYFCGHRFFERRALRPPGRRLRKLAATSCRVPSGAALRLRQRLPGAGGSDGVYGLGQEV